MPITAKGAVYIVLTTISLIIVALAVVAVGTVVIWGLADWGWLWFWTLPAGIFCCFAIADFILLAFSIVGVVRKTSGKLIPALVVTALEIVFHVAGPIAFIVYVATSYDFYVESCEWGLFVIGELSNLTLSITRFIFGRLAYVEMKALKRLGQVSSVEKELTEQNKQNESLQWT
ncbi:unnamed protein product, partial [Mesorhabditis belari]|uniref:Transmembrane protein n=1 Tax=Mesorhabditis belari TaxID=2138241 RepID=A0AAF3EL69_9BILA